MDRAHLAPPSANYYVCNPPQRSLRHCFSPITEARVSRISTIPAGSCGCSSSNGALFWSAAFLLSRPGLVCRAIPWPPDRPRQHIPKESNRLRTVAFSKRLVPITPTSSGGTSGDGYRRRAVNGRRIRVRVFTCFSRYTITVRVVTK